jgi:hypothetical protein
LETTRQILLRKYLAHSTHCSTCQGSGSIFGEMCPIGQAIHMAYGKGVREEKYSHLHDLEKLNWDQLALATLRAEDETDQEWVVSLDAIIAQKVEYIWAMSEEYWRRHGYSSSQA